MKTRSLFVLAACLATLSLPALAADWPQWRGPHRDNVSAETGLLKTWPSGGPKLLWTYEAAGIGYSGPAVVGKRLYTLGADEKSESVYALDTDTGKKVWSTEIGSAFSNPYGGGPRSTPTVDGDMLYVLGAQGELVCLESATGRQIWSTNSVTGSKNGASINITPQGSSFFLFTDEGNLIRAQLSPAGYREISRSHLIDPTWPFGQTKFVYAPPAFANRHVFARNDEELVCASLAAKPPK